MSRRGGRWGMNFISSSGPQSHLSMNSLQATEATALDLQQRSGDSSRPAAFAPPSSFGAAPPVAQSSFAPGYNPQKRNSSGGSSGSLRAFSNLGKRRMHDDDEYVSKLVALIAL